MYLFIPAFLYLYIYSSIYLCIPVFIYLYIYSSIYLFLYFINVYNYLSI